MRLKDYLTALLFLCFLSGLVIYVNQAEWVPVDAFSIVDGDTLARGSDRYRLAGIDAPELDQRCLNNGRGLLCGEQSKAHLEALIRNVALECAEDGKDQYQRILVICRERGAPSSGSLSRTDLPFDTPGFEPTLNARMVLDGWAVAYGDYAGLELLARTAERGIWATDFERPADWRRAQGIR